MVDDVATLLRREFPLADDLVHLNHAGIGPWPRRCADAVQRFAETCATRSYAGHFDGWMEAESRLRERLRALINAPSADDIALLKNTSEGLSQVAHGLRWQPGDRVVALAEEFISNLLPWEALGRHGVELVKVVPQPGQSPDEALEAACDARTRLMAVSSVQYGSGWRSDLVRLGRFCRGNDILLCIDAIQSLGALRFDTAACNADFVVSGSHKWLMSPPGVALFYCRAELRDSLAPLAYGWHTVSDPLGFSGSVDDMDPSARRFEAGTPNLAGILGFEATLSLLDEIGIAEVERRVMESAAWLAAELAARAGVQLVSAPDGVQLSGNVCLRVEHPAALADRLEADYGVLCAARGGHLRFSPHCHTTRAQLEHALACFDRACYALNTV